MSRSATPAEPYPDSHALLADELALLDLLIRRRLVEFRGASQPQAEEQLTRSVYISDDEVDRLLEQAGTPPDTDRLSAIDRQLEAASGEIDERLAAPAPDGFSPSLERLARLFGLSPAERRALVICLAPELDDRYDRLYAYLQDDITRKRPSVNLALDLLYGRDSHRWAARQLFHPDAPLLRYGLLQVAADPQSPSGSSDLAQLLRLDARVLDYLLETQLPDSRLSGVATLRHFLPELADAPQEETVRKEILTLVEKQLSPAGEGRRNLVTHLSGAYGSGKRALALGVCTELGCPAVVVDAELLVDSDASETLWRLAFREGLLSRAAVVVDGLDALRRAPADARPHLKRLAGAVREYGWLTFLVGRQHLAPDDLFAPAVFHSMRLEMPTMPTREAVWSRALAGLDGCSEAWAGQLAKRFRLTGGRILDAARVTGNRIAADGDGTPRLADLSRACREQSSRMLSDLAAKIEPRYGWNDIVLPDGKLELLREICSQVEHRHRVLGDWGFDRKLAYGKGLSALFTGPPGTGKTMAAEVMSNHMALDLYKIDLSRVVSKYIGETEKNLSKIFEEAEASNAVLFFDEADALFGKRTEVTDAHDRYANIETSYLLQKMEEYEGIVILASNLRQNMDEAFTRRIRFVVEFPFPDHESRQRIWQAHFPEAAPLGDLDYEWLSRQLEISGGNIKNIVLNAAFLAASNGGAIEMTHVLHGARREFEKIGKLWDAGPLDSAHSSKTDGRRAVTPPGS